MTIEELAKRCIAAGAERFETCDGDVVFGIKANGSYFPEIAVQPIGHKETAVASFLGRCRQIRDAMNIVLGE